MSGRRESSFQLATSWRRENGMELAATTTGQARKSGTTRSRARCLPHGPRVRLLDHSPWSRCEGVRLRRRDGRFLRGLWRLFNWRVCCISKHCISFSCNSSRRSIRYSTCPAKSARYENAAVSRQPVKKKGGVEQSLSCNITGDAQVFWFVNSVQACNSMDESMRNAVSKLVPVYA